MTKPIKFIVRGNKPVRRVWGIKSFERVVIGKKSYRRTRDKKKIDPGE